MRSPLWCHVQFTKQEHPSNSGSALSPLPCPTADYRRNERSHISVLLQGARFALASLAMLQFSVLGPLADRAQAHEKEGTRTLIKHVIVIVGENRSFDHLFATFRPCLDMEVHRAQLGSSSDQLTQPRQFAKPEVGLGQPVRSGKQSGNRRSVWSVPFRSRPRRRSRSGRSLTCRGSNAKSCEGRAAAKAALFVAAGKGLFQSSSNRFRSAARK